MKNSSKITIYAASTIAAVFTFGATSLVATSGAEARPFGVCKPPVRAMARASGPIPYQFKRLRAIRKARRKWKRKVSFWYGPRYKKWFRAVRKRVHCEGAAGSVYCRVRAKPCKRRPFFKRGFKRGGPHINFRIR